MRPLPHRDQAGTAHTPAMATAEHIAGTQHAALVECLAGERQGMPAQAETLAGVVADHIRAQGRRSQGDGFLVQRRPGKHGDRRIDACTVPARLVAMAAQAAQGIGIGKARALAGIQSGTPDQVGNISERAFAARCDDASCAGFGETRDAREAQPQGVRHALRAAFRGSGLRRDALSRE